MLAQRYRFHGYNSLRFVYKNGEAVRSQLFVIKFSHNPRRRHSRVAVVVSKKIWKRAVGRNRIRRRLYELLRQELPNIRDSLDIVCIVASPDVHAMPSDELKRYLHEMFTSANLYKEGVEDDIIK
ncbi:MAG TPA: ribonuclease P protein component [Candidatus Saccharimonadales bacterium]